jgi:hypothetical protein
MRTPARAALGWVQLAVAVFATGCRARRPIPPTLQNRLASPHIALRDEFAELAQETMAANKAADDA